MSGALEADNAGTSEVRPEHRFDEAALERWMTAHVEGFKGPLRQGKFAGGQSNPTYRIDSPSGSYVLRRILNPMGTVDAIEFLLDKLRQTKTNGDFFDSMNT